VPDQLACIALQTEPLLVLTDPDDGRVVALPDAQAVAMAAALVEWASLPFARTIAPPADQELLVLDTDEECVDLVRRLLAALYERRQSLEELARMN
jgi:hypothetical protein